MCRRVDELIRAWERTGSLKTGELALVSEHLRRCRRCACAHAALLPLLRRDAGGRSGLPVGPVGPGTIPARFTEQLMRRLAATVPARAGRRGAARLAFALAAVAVLLAAGLGVWLGGLLPSGQEVLVRFELVAPEAGSVSLVGDFNGWDPNRLPMKDVTGQGTWRVAIRLKRGTVYTYNFLMDGRQWVADPGSLRQVDDGFGGTSSVLEL